MSNNKSQISPIPPEPYGDRFVNFISGVTKTKEEQERELQSSEQLDGSIDMGRRGRMSHENKVVQKAEKEAYKTEKEGAVEEPQRDRTMSTLRSSSAERSGGLQGATLPVVEEDGEAGSRENINELDEKASRKPMDDTRGSDEDRPQTDPQLPSLPNFNRLSMGMSSKTPVTGTGS